MIAKVLKLISGKFGIYALKVKHLPLGNDLAVDVRKLFPSEDIEIIFDVGANIGQSVEQYRKQFPRAKVYCFEPIKETFNQLKRNFGGNKNVSLHRLAFGDSSGIQSVPIQDNSQWNSLSSKVNLLKILPAETQEVEVKLLDDFVNKQGLSHIDLLKIDTEGYELEVLRGAGECLSNNQVSFILVESGFVSGDPRHTPFTDLVELLREFQFDVVGIYDQCIEKSTNCLLYANVLFRHVDVVQPQLR